MRALVVYCHPKADSFNAAVKDLVIDKLRRAGADVRLIDLYQRGFAPVLTPAEWTGYLTCPDNCADVSHDVADLRWCDTLVFVYPTWWYGLPAILKGWLDRVMLPDVAFLMPDAEHRNIRPGLRHIKRLGVFTTCGASWWLTKLIGSPGRRTLMWGVGLLCAKGKRAVFQAHYLMDSSTDFTRRSHLDRVSRKMDRLIGRKVAPVPAQAVEAAE